MSFDVATGPEHGPPGVSQTFVGSFCDDTVWENVDGWAGLARGVHGVVLYAYDGANAVDRVKALITEA